MPLLLKLVIVIAAAFAVLSVVVGPRRAWALWSQFGQILGDLIARIVMTLFYFSIVVPFALISRRHQDPLSLRPAKPPYWLPHDTDADTLESARRQF